MENCVNSVLYKEENKLFCIFLPQNSWYMEYNVIQQQFCVNVSVFRYLAHDCIFSFQELELNREDSKKGRLNSSEFISLFKEMSTRPEIYFLLVRQVYGGIRCLCMAKITQMICRKWFARLSVCRNQNSTSEYSHPNQFLYISKDEFFL